MKIRFELTTDIEGIFHEWLFLVILFGRQLNLKKNVKNVVNK